MNRLTSKLSLFILLTLIVVVADCYIWVYAIAIRKDTDFRYRPVGLAELYLPSERPVITGFKFPRRNEMVLEISPAPRIDSTWTITDDGGSLYTTTGKFPKIILLQKEHLYTVQRTDSEGTDFYRLDFSLKVDYASRELYAEQNDSLDDTYRIVSSTLPVGNYRKHPVDAFIDTAYFSDDIAETRRILDEEVGINETDGTRKKIEKIGLFILSGIDDKRGIPAKNLSRKALAEYTCALDGTSEIWCTQFAKIYALFANVAGIPTRFVSLGGRVDGVSLSAHAFTESFVRETGQWAYVDLFSRILFVSNSHGNMLNTVDLFMLQQAGVEQGLSAMVFKNSRIQRVPYAEVSDDIAYYFNRDATFIFGRKKIQPLRQYRRLELAVNLVLNPDLAYSLRNSSSKHFLAVGLFYVTPVFLFIWLLLFVRMMIRHRRSRTWSREKTLVVMAGESVNADDTGRAG